MASTQVIQWNCRNINSGLPHLLHYLKDHPKTDLLLLQSLDVGPTKLPHIPGFYHPPAYSTENNRVMTATYISTKLKYTEAKIDTPNNDCRLSLNMVSIPTSTGKQLNVANTYYPRASRRAYQTDWLTKLDPSSGSWIVGGDFNCHNKLWDMEADDNTDVHLVDAINNSMLVILNDGLPTRIGQTNQRDTAVDLTLVSPDLALDADWEIGTDPLQSDHLPIHINIGVQADEADQDQTLKYQYHKANWEDFQLHLRLSCNPQSFNPWDDNIEVHYDNIRSAILTAADNSIPKKATPKGRQQPSTAVWWNNDCDAATHAKRKALRLYQANRTAANKTALMEASKACTKALAEAKKEHWEQFCQQEIKAPGDLHKIWKKVKTMRGLKKRPEKQLSHNGITTKNSQEKANILAENQPNHPPARQGTSAEKSSRSSTPRSRPQRQHLPLQR